MANNTELIDIITKLLRQERFGVLSTIGNPWPHPSLIGFFCEHDFSQVYFFTSRETRKFRNLNSNPAVSLMIDNRSRPLVNLRATSTLTVFGDARVLNDQEKASIRELFLNRHPELSQFSGLGNTAACTIDVDHYNLVYNFGEVFHCRPEQLRQEQNQLS